MAQQTREIKRRIQSVRNTQQITRAMEMIAATKLRRAQERAAKAEPFRKQMETSLRRTLATALSLGEELPPIAGLAGDGPPCLIAITSDRGLAGGYNAAVIRRAEERLAEHGEGAYLVTVGRKARDHFRRRKQNLLAEYVYLGDQVPYRKAEEMGEFLQGFYLQEQFGQLEIIYTRFVNRISQRVETLPVLPPLDLNLDQAKNEQIHRVTTFEPSLQGVLAQLVPLYVDAVIYYAVTHSLASEQAARMNAMRNATDNAGEIIRSLNLSYNRARQADITKELAEIVGGADALEA